MPRMELTEAEVALIKKHRRETEIDRTHDAALQLAHQIMDDILEKHFNEHGNGGLGHVHRVELASKFAEALKQHERMR